MKKNANYAKLGYLPNFKLFEYRSVASLQEVVWDWKRMWWEPGTGEPGGSPGGGARVGAREYWSPGPLKVVCPRLRFFTLFRAYIVNQKTIMATYLSI